jgi:hypothetical protein
MGARTDMALALERLLAPETGHPAHAPESGADSQMEVSVVFTSVKATLAALRTAGALAHRLRSRITMVVPQIVPYPLPLTSPPVLLDFSERQFRVLAGQSPVETTVRIYLCRDRLDALLLMLKPRSLVVIGGRRRWWPTADARLIRQLRRAGHEVVFAETE